MNQYQEIDDLFKEKIPPKEGEEAEEVVDEVLNAHLEIIALQKNEKAKLKTGIDHTDNILIDGLTNKMIFYGSRPSMGKTYTCDQIIESLTDEEINPMEVDVLRLNWEMQTKALLLRKLKINLGKSMRDIVSTPYTEEEKIVVKKTVSQLRHPKLTNYSKIVEGEVLKHIVKKFVEKDNPDLQKEKVVLVDHLHILTKKDRIDNFLSICNELKLQYNKLSFVFFFQLNRELEKRWKGSKDSKPNPKNFRAHSGDIYNTDNLMQYADLICTLIIPQVVNLEEYAAVYRGSHEHLSDHFLNDDLMNDWVRLKGTNRIYYEYIKNRLMDDFDEPKLFCQVLDKEKEAYAPKVTASQQPMVKTPVGPQFIEEPYKNIEPISDMSVAFDAPEEDNGDGDMPF